MAKQGNLMIGMISCMTAFKGQDNKHGKEVRGTDQITKEWKKEWMKPLRGHYTRTWYKQIL
eukprot:7638608-Heterocapsa_arctica.AAC.1